MERVSRCGCCVRRAEWTIARRGGAGVPQRGSADLQLRRKKSPVDLTRAVVSGQVQRRLRATALRNCPPATAASSWLPSSLPPSLPPSLSPSLTR